MNKITTRVHSDERVTIIPVREDEPELEQEPTRSAYVPAFEPMYPEEKITSEVREQKYGMRDGKWGNRKAALAGIRARAKASKG